MKHLFILLGFGLVAGLHAAEPEYLGATAVLQHMEEKPEVDSDDDADSVEKFRRDVEQLKSERAGLAPEVAAERWLALCARLIDLKTGRDPDSYSLEFKELVTALPSPNASLRARCPRV